MSPPKVPPRQVRWLKAMLKSDLDTTAKVVGCAIAAHMDRYGRAYPSKETLRRFCSISKPAAVDRAVDRLEQAGWISVERSHGRHPNRYHGHLNPLPTSGGSQQPQEQVIPPT